MLGEWTATDVLAHLLAVDALAGRGTRPADPPETGSGADVSHPDGQRGAAWRNLLREALAVWRAQAAAITRHTAAVGRTGDDAAGALPRHRDGGGDVLLDRPSETWVHAEDLRAVLGQPALDPAPGDVHPMSDLGVRMLPGAWLSAGGDLDDERWSTSSLTGPGGARVAGWPTGRRGAARCGARGLVARLGGGRRHGRHRLLPPRRGRADRTRCRTASRVTGPPAHVLAATALLAQP